MKQTIQAGIAEKLTVAALPDARLSQKPASAGETMKKQVRKRGFPEVNAYSGDGVDEAPSRAAFLR